MLELTLFAKTFENAYVSLLRVDLFALGIPLTAWAVHSLTNSQTKQPISYIHIFHIQILVSI